MVWNSTSNRVRSELWLQAHARVKTYVKRKAFIQSLALPALCLLATPSCLAMVSLVGPGDFQNQTRPPAPDYATAAHWSARPDTVDEADQLPPDAIDGQERAQADVFFVHPTTHFSNDHWNANLADEDVNQITDLGSIKRQATVFNCCARIYAPRYRQASIFAFIDDSQDALQALDLAYGDVRAAFEYYLKYENRGRPLIVAAHSQGTLHATRLMREFLPKIRGRLIAAYLIGGAVYRDEFPSSAGRGAGDVSAAQDFRVCERANQTGCFVTYRAVARGTSLINLPLDREGVAAHCVNPLDWSANSTAIAPAALHRGAVPPDLSRVDPELHDANCDDAGLLNITPPRGSLDEIYEAGNRGNYHRLDYNLFYMNLRANIRERIAAFHR